MLQSSSNVRVFVHWPEQTVFSGEEIECQITFKNIATTIVAPGSSPSNSLNGFVPSGERQRKASPTQATTAQAKKRNASDSRSMVSSRGHQPTLSLSAPASNGRLQQEPRAGKSGQSGASTAERSHRRSVSIISLGISDGPGDEESVSISVGDGSRRPSRGHIRASSLQIVPRRSGVSSTGPLSAPFAHRSTTQISPLFRTSATSNAILPTRHAPVDRSSAVGEPSRIAAVPTHSSTHKASNRRRDSASFPQNFRFPSPSSPLADQLIVEPVPHNEVVSPHTAAVSNKLLSSRGREDLHQYKDQSNIFTKVLSPTINGETPRSSGEFYSLSNNSTETLVSEYLPQQPGRTQQQAIHARRTSNMATINQHRSPEILMMGYAQISGSFMLDGSLVNQTPFEEVKRKGVSGGHGGGVIGIETNKRDSGLLRGFGWANLGESLGGFLGGGELSSIKDMRGIASTKSVPLLSTPQSILFVDLRLAPGESRSYKYSVSLPRGLPPSHRGKAIKIVYNLVIGTQRPGGAKEQQVKSVDFPFRVLGSVNEHGELLGHDLMSPYIIMQDQAQIHSVETPVSAIGSSEPKRSKLTQHPLSTLNDFLNYTDDLLTRPRQNSSLGLLSPTEVRPSRRTSSFLMEPSSARDAIDLAILRSNLATESQQSSNRFEVSREGRRVAVIMLARPAYRLGETVTAAIEFTGAKIPCYAVHASLETSEKVDGAIALRSDATIHRVTRKIHSSHSDPPPLPPPPPLFPPPPPPPPPPLPSSGVSLEWKILIEFVTHRFQELPENGRIMYGRELLDEVSRDERGVVLAATEGMDCESFEIAVPLRVYGALTGPIEKDDESRGFVV